MKDTGVIRKLDVLGRIAIPIELRRERNIEYNDQIEIGVNEDEIILKKYVPRCVFCKGRQGVREVMGKNICMECLEDLKYP